MINNNCVNRIFKKSGDILLSTHSNTNSWGQPMNPSNVINYPKQGEKSGLITLVRVIAEQVSGLNIINSLKKNLKFN